MRPPLEMLLSLVGLLAGLVLAFSGYHLARSLAALAGFLSGFVFGLVVGAAAGPVGSLVAALVLGVAFALLFALAFRLVGGALGALAGLAVAQTFAWPLWAVVAAVVAGGVLGIWANRAAIVVATALMGAGLAVPHAAALAADIGLVGGVSDTQLLVASLVLAILGALVQGRRVRREG